MKFKDVTFAIDFDGTCVMHCFPEIGTDCPGAVEVLNWIVDNGGRLVLNTMRSNREDAAYLSDAVQWFHKRKIILSGVNRNPTQESWTSSPKVYANIYIDDAALGCPLMYDPTLCDRPFVRWDKVKELLEKDCWQVEKIIK